MKIFFQSSLPRSGSTLLQNIMGQNSDFYVTPTSGVLELLYAARANYTNSLEFKSQDPQTMKNGFLSFCKFGLVGFYNGITTKKYILDKSRGWGVHYNFLNSFYPDPKIICMVRDIADIFCSMEKKFRENQHLDSGMVNHVELKGTTTLKRVNIWANGIPIGVAVERLEQMIHEGIDKNILFIRYEDLTTQPQREIERIYEFLDIPPFAHNFDAIEQLTKEDDTVYGLFGDHKIETRIKPQKSRAKEILGEDICKDLRRKYAWFYEYFKY